MARNHLVDDNRFVCIEKGLTILKGKGEFKTHFVEENLQVKIVYRENWGVFMFLSPSLKIQNNDDGLSRDKVVVLVVSVVVVVVVVAVIVVV